jgi:hypothetical protein
MGEIDMGACRGHGGAGLSRTLNLSKASVAQHLSLPTKLLRSEESSNPLAMDLCIPLGLAHDDTVTAELRSTGPASTAGVGRAR